MVVAGLVKYTGVSEAFVEGSNLMIDDGNYRKELLRVARTFTSNLPPMALLAWCSVQERRGRTHSENTQARNTQLSQAPDQSTSGRHGVILKGSSCENKQVAP